MSEQPVSKEENDDWSVESLWWGEGFELRLTTEGNEAAGEVPHTNADMHLGQHLKSEDCSLEPGHRPTTTESSRCRQFETAGVEMTLEMRAYEEQVEAEFEAICDIVRETLGDEWEVA
jgi:hypothetical protein